MTDPILALFGVIAFGACVMLFVLSLGPAVRAARVAQARAAARAAPATSTQVRPRSPLLDLLLPITRVLAEVVSVPAFDGLRSYFARPYTRAGRPGDLTLSELLALTFVIGVGLWLFLTFAFTLIVGVAAPLVALIGFPAALLGVAASLKARAEQRETQITVNLPYAMDLLVLILRSGTALSIALRQLVSDYRSHPIGEEFGIVLAEIEMGANRQEAFERLASRIGLDDVRTLSDTVVQSEELGWPLADSLQRMADRLATERVLRAQEAAGRAGVMVMLPSTLILAAVLLILFGPTIVRAMSGGFGL